MPRAQCVLLLFGSFFGGKKEGRGFQGIKLIAEPFELALGGIETPFRLFYVPPQFPEFFLETSHLAP